MMRHIFRFGGRDRHFTPEHHRGPGGPHGHGPHDGPPQGPRRGRRPFDYGDLRLIVLAMIAEAPRHGYELMKAIEARMGGGYSPSPGVIYPTLAWLEDMGYAASDAEGGRRSYRLTPEGGAFLEANREALAALEGRMGEPRRHDKPEPVMEAMAALKRALRTRFAQGPVDAAAAEAIAAAIRVAAGQVEETVMSETETGDRLTSTAIVTTAKAVGYAAQLCKHFAHKIPARFEEGRGEIEFRSGRCTVAAEGDRLTLGVEAATPEALAEVEDVVARHLLRFAFREEFAVDWQRG